MYFEVLGEITHVETFASGSSIRELARLRKFYGRGRWRKRRLEVHWYEAQGIGRKEFKIKRYID